MDKKTLETYDNQSLALAEYFRGIGSRVWDIEKAFELAGKSDGTADVLELGCGDGRDALGIIPRSRTYLGIDYSIGMIELARQMTPDGDFRLADMESFDYPTEAYDVVFAFASFLHLDKDSLQRVLRKVANTLRPGGVLYLSNKYADEYKAEIKQDQFGDRMFYFYNPEIIGEMTAGIFEIVEVNRDAKGTAPWFQMGLRKY